MDRGDPEDNSGQDQPRLLSLVMGARNDRYMGNFRYRITTTLNYMARNLAEIGRLDDVEILITDWASRTPLSEALTLSSAAAKICGFIYVPAEVSLAVQPDGSYHSTIPINAGLRRGTGKFLGLFDSDSLYQAHSLKALLDLLDGRPKVAFDINRALYVLGRSHIPTEMVLTEPSLQEWDRFLLLSAGSLRKESTAGGLGVSTACQIMSRSLWFEHRGYDERLGGWGWSDAELALRVTQRCPWVDLFSFGVTAYHMDHSVPGEVPVYERQNPTNVVSMAPHVNDETWGLAGVELDVSACRNVREPPAGNRLEAGRGAALNKTVGEIGEEIGDKRVARHAELTITKSGLPRADWELLCLVSWYGLYHHPRILLDFGAAEAGAALAVYLASPNVEIYGMDPLQDLDNLSAFSIPLHDVRGMTRLGFSGYRRLITGDPETAFQRLRESFVGPFVMDLIIFRADLFPEKAGERLAEVLPHLGPGGAVCVTAGSPARLAALWAETAAKFPDFARFRCASGKTGLLINAMIAEQASDAASGSYDETIPDLGKPRSVAAALVRNAIRKLGKPSRYPAYVRQLLRLISS